MFHDPTFWVAVAFLLFIGALFKPVKKILLSGLDKRSEQIREELDQALRLKEEAQELLSSYQRQQQEVEKEAQAIIKEAESEAKLIAQKAEKDLEENLNKRIDMAMQKISAYEASVLQEIREKALDATTAAVTEAIKKQVSSDKANALIESSIKQFAA